MTAALEHIRSLVAEYDAQDPLRREPWVGVPVEALRELDQEIRKLEDQVLRLAEERDQYLQQLRARDGELLTMGERLRRAEERLEDLQSKLAARGVTL